MRKKGTIFCRFTLNVPKCGCKIFRQGAQRRNSSLLPDQFQSSSRNFLQRLCPLSVPRPRPQKDTGCIGRCQYWSQWSLLGLRELSARIMPNLNVTRQSLDASSVPFSHWLLLTCVRCLPPEFLLVARVTCISVLPSVEAAVSPPGVAFAPSSVGEKSDPNVNALILTLNKSSRRFYFVSRCGIFFFPSKVHKILVDTLWKFSLELCMTTKKNQKKQKY